MYKDLWRQRPLLNFPQIIILLLIGAAVFIAVDLNRRAQAGQLVGLGESELQAQVDAEATRQVSLQVTRDYVQSEDYVAAYARDEAGYVLPGEKRVVPLVIEATPLPTAVPSATPDPIQHARPWQAWWQLLVDVPPPAR